MHIRSVFCISVKKLDRTCGVAIKATSLIRLNSKSPKRGIIVRDNKNKTAACTGKNIVQRNPAIRQKPDAEDTCIEATRTV